MAKSTKRNALATTPPSEGPLVKQETEVAAMFGGSDVYQVPTDAPLPQAKIMRESGQFEMPNGEMAKAFEGHILLWHEANCYWSHAFGEGDGSFPDCSSSDGIYPDGGENRQAEACADCPMNEYGTDLKGGRGKACQNMILLYIVLDGQRLPFILKAPPSSLGKKESLIRWLTNSINEGYAGKYQTIAVRFSLQKKQFEQYTASILQLETVRVLDPNVPEDARQLQRLGKLFAEVQKYYRKRGAQDVAATDRYAGETPDDGIPI